MKIAILGYATEGRVSYEYYKKQGHEVVIHDSNPEVDIPEGADAILGDSWLDNLDQYDLLVRTAGLNPDKIHAKNPDLSGKTTTAINEFFEVSPSKNLIGVTGTKGKGTTSTLVTRILEKAGKRVYLAGNIGRSPIEIIDEIQPNDWVVLELSSFQLCDVRHSPHIMACLMMVPEHLNWHKDLNDYINAKSNAFIYQTPDDIAVFYADNDLTQKVVSPSKGKKVPYGIAPGAYIRDSKITIEEHEICDKKDISLLGAHNLQNICAAITIAWQAGVKDAKAIKEAVCSFSGLPLRLEFIREVNGVKYYNDSFGTTPETAIVALQSFSEPIILVAGGSDKGTPYDEMAKTIISSNVKAVMCIGETGVTIQKLIERYAENTQTKAPKTYAGFTDMKAVVTKAFEVSKPGDIVLLSTGSASFDMFKDYYDRGNQFNQAVQELV